MAGEISRYSSDGRRSGDTYLSEENQRLQDDDFANPGLLWVERGWERWSQVDGAAAASCAGCHGHAAASMRGVRTRYPLFDPTHGVLINWSNGSIAAAFFTCKPRPTPIFETLLDLTAFIGFQSRDMPINVRIDGLSQPFFEAGKAFLSASGQLDMACAHCHEQYAGQRLRGDIISQGQINGFPIYRFTWQTLGSTHRMFEWCNTSVRAKPYRLGSDEYVNLDLFLTWRGRRPPG